VLARLRSMTWQDWAVPLQILLGLSLLAIALAQVPNEALGRTEFRAASAISAKCASEAH